MAEIYVFGTAAADLVLRMPELPRPGGHSHAALYGWLPGGSAANLACALASAGHHVNLVGPIGNDPVADAIISELEQYNVCTSHLARQPTATPRTLILIDNTGERSIVGLDPPERPPVTDVAVPAGVAHADLIYVESFHKYPAHLADSAPAALVVVPPPDDLTAPGTAHLVVGSTAQLPPPWADSPYDHARTHFGAQLRWIVLTNGPNGATAYGAHERIAMPAEPAEQLDATGAGDAFAAGLLHSLLAGEPIKAAMARASTWGGAAVEQYASIPPSFQQVFDRA